MHKPKFTKAVGVGLRLLLQGRYSLSFDQLEFNLHNLKLSKRLNLLIQGGQLLLRSVQRLGIAPILQIEPINSCNLRCLTCATGNGMMKRPSTLMPFELYRQVIDQVKDYICFVAFWSWGEPFMHQDALRMIRYAKDQGLAVHTSTNGHFFNTRERARGLIQSGLDSLIVAVDGLDQPTYERYRQGGRLELVIKSIENLVAERSALGVKHPLITLRFIVMKHNEHQVGRVREFAQRLGVDVLTFRSAVVQRGEFNIEDELTPAAQEFQQYNYQGLPTREHRLKRNSFYCHRPYANLTIFSNGDVVCCENDFNASLVLGNVKEESLRSILGSEKSRSFLQAFRKDLEQFSFCRTCENRDMKQDTANVKTYVLNKEFYDYAKGN